MKKKEKKRIQIYICLGVSILIFLFSYFLIYPLVLDVKEKRKEVLAAEEIFKQKTAVVEKFSKVAEKYQSLSSETQKIDKIISSDFNLPKSLLQLEVLAENNGMIMEHISFGDFKSEKGLSVVPINIELFGSYNSFKNYLGAALKSIPLIDIRSINFNSKEKIEEVYNFSLSINIYSKKAVVSLEEESKEGEEEENID